MIFPRSLLGLRAGSRSPRIEIVKRKQAELLERLKRSVHADHPVPHVLVKQPIALRKTGFEELFRCATGKLVMAACLPLVDHPCAPLELSVSQYSTGHAASQIGSEGRGERAFATQPCVRGPG